MEIRILQMLEGAKKAEGIAVVIDVFRAFSVEAYLFAGGAKKVIPVADENLAYRLKAEHPEYLLDFDKKFCTIGNNDMLEALRHDEILYEVSGVDVILAEE